MPDLAVAIPASLTAGSVERLHAQIVDAASAPGPVVLRGDADRFCTGLALETIDGEQDVLRGTAAFAECLGLLRALARPVVAVVEGEVTGGGVGIVAAADLVIASERATFALSEIVFGLVPAIIAPALLGRLSPSRLTSWTLLAERWDAATARRYGLVDVVTADHELEQALAAHLRRLRRADAGAVAELKRHVAAVAAGRGSDGVAMTTRLLKDGQVQDRIRRFTLDGVAPWTENDQ